MEGNPDNTSEASRSSDQSGVNSLREFTHRRRPAGAVDLHKRLDHPGHGSQETQQRRDVADAPENDDIGLQIGNGQLRDLTHDLAQLRGGQVPLVDGGAHHRDDGAVAFLAP